MANYKEKIFKLLEENMTEKSFKLWEGINRLLPDTWDKPTSSTGKYHKKLNGTVPTQAEHVYQMLFSAVKIFKFLGCSKKTQNADKLLFAIALHDSLKYGMMGNRVHTDNKHDKEAADMISSNRETFLKVLNENHFYVMEEAVRFHSGRWSTDVPRDKEFDFKDYNPETMFIHMLDMLSTADLLQTDVRD
jgi:hypothetical protein